jgi:hypothetical protein
MNDGYLRYRKRMHGLIRLAYHVMRDNREEA